MTIENLAPAVLGDRRVIPLSDEFALFLAGEEDLPPSVATVSGWETTGEVLDLDLGKDGWIEAWVLRRI